MDAARPNQGPLVPQEHAVSAQGASFLNCAGDGRADHQHGFLDLETIAQVIEPLQVKGPAVGSLSGISIDTRKPMGDDVIFWAIRGPHFNGGDFAQDALNAGAKAAVVSRDTVCDTVLPQGRTMFLVEDTLRALQRLAAWRRSKLDCPVIGVTGSNGKTLVKEMLASILCLDRKTYRSPLSYNTQVGAALGILGCKPEAQVAIIEAGISLPGEMDRLETMIRPDHGILTTISKAHIGGLVSLENTIEEKLRLFKNLGPESFLILNADDELCMRFGNRGPARKVKFGIHKQADIRARDITRTDGQGHIFTLDLPDASLPIHLAAPGFFNVSNALAAAAAAFALGVSAELIKQGLEQFHPSPMRLEIHTTATGVTLINDTYNSDPASMKGALDVLAKVGAGRRKIAILSDMLDLGLHSREEHLDVGKDVLRAGADYLITVGENSALIGEAAAREGMSPMRIVNTATYREAAGELEKIMNRGDVVLFKGSRWFRLERIAKELVGSIGPTRLTVNLDALAANIHAVRSIVGDSVEIMAVVKSFGYGNDSIRASKVALDNGVGYLAVAFPDEGVTLRENRIQAPILVFNVFPEEADKIVRNNLSVVIPSLELAESLDHYPLKGLKIAAHLKIDTGMGRSGIWVEDALPFVEKVLSMKNLAVEGIMTHFSSADDPAADDYTLRQIALFEELLAELERRGHTFKYIHAAATAALVRFPQSRFNMVRPGLGIYGLHPSDAVRDELKLEEVITFTTKIAQIKDHPAGRAISYNRRYITPRPTRAALLHVGYNDGYPRFQTNVGQVLIHGKRARILGTVCMDSIMVDVTYIPEARIGDEATLIGRQGNEKITADDIAANGSTVNYEIICKISPRVTRIFVQS